MSVGILIWSQLNMLCCRYNLSWVTDFCLPIILLNSFYSRLDALPFIRTAMRLISWLSAIETCTYFGQFCMFLVCQFLKGFGRCMYFLLAWSLVERGRRCCTHVRGLWGLLMLTYFLGMFGFLAGVSWFELVLKAAMDFADLDDFILVHVLVYLSSYVS